jgi:HNH endonuclease/AP2 domain
MIKMTPKRIANFWMKVKKRPNGCWEWAASCTKNGYGRFQINPRTYKAHRISYFIAHGQLPVHLLVCHTCDNKKCVNPSHLFLGTSKQNTQDMISKDRLNKDRGKHKGISYRKETGKWRARYMRDYKNILVGEFDTYEEASSALHEARESP